MTNEQFDGNRPILRESFKIVPMCTIHCWMSTIRPLSKFHDSCRHDAQFLKQKNQDEARSLTESVKNRFSRSRKSSASPKRPSTSSIKLYSTSFDSASSTSTDRKWFIGMKMDGPNRKVIQLKVNSSKVQFNTCPSNFSLLYFQLKDNLKENPL